MLAVNESRTHGKSLVTRDTIEEGELLVIFDGDECRFDELADLPEEYRAHVLQIDDDRFLVSRKPWPVADYVNHACDPTAVLQDDRTLIAVRRISIGEEIAYDYATSDSAPYDEFDCQCGSSLCRGKVTADDWKRPDLQQRYGLRFSPYLLRKIRATKGKN